MESQWRSAAFSFLTHSIIKVIDLLHKNIARGKIQSRNRPVILEVRKIVRCQAARECAHPSTERCSRRLRIKWRYGLQFNRHAGQRNQCWPGFIPAHIHLDIPWRFQRSRSAPSGNWWNGQMSNAWPVRHGNYGGREKNRGRRSSVYSCLIAGWRYLASPVNHSTSILLCPTCLHLRVKTRGQSSLRAKTILAEGPLPLAQRRQAS